MDLELIRERFEGSTAAHIRMSDPFDGKTAKTVRKGVSNETLKDHLSGKIRIGFLPFIDGTDRCKYAGWDIDTGQVEHLTALCAVLRKLDVLCHIETSKSRGWHVWLFCDRIPAEKLRRFGLWVIKQAELEGIVKEFFPKQTDPTKTGNGIWLPFFGVRSSDQSLNNGRCRFVDPAGRLLNQETTLALICPLKESELDGLLDRYEVPNFDEIQKSAPAVNLADIPDELPERFTKMLQTDTELRNAWNGERRPPTDNSRSGFDAMLAGMLVVREYTDGEIARILREYPKGRGKEATEPYLIDVIAKARKWEAESRNTTPYRIKDGCIGYRKPIVRKSEIVDWDFIKLCNFTARVTEETERDNGVEVFKTFAIEGRLDSRQKLPRIEFPASQFAGLRWIVDQWGIRAIMAGQSNKDRLREAIQVFSSDAAVRTVYTYTGWKYTKEGWIYLHAGGAVGAKGSADSINVDLERPLNRYRLPDTPKDVAAAIKCSLALLDIASYDVTVPLLSAVYLAPLCEILHPDFGLWLYGATGSMKSTLAALFLSHYGEFDRTNLPASWESTENALEKRLFTLKDALCVIDDFAPKSDSYAQAKMEKVAQRVVRAQGNLSGRSRMRADTSLRPDYPPRGLIISTGEDLPPGQSILARLLTVELDKPKIDMERLTAAQGNADRLPYAMAGYLAMLSGEMEELKERLPILLQQMRQSTTLDSTHLRVPEIVAHLNLGLFLFLEFAKRAGGVSEDQTDQIFEEGQTAIMDQAKAHGRRIAEADPAEVFLSTLTSLLAQGAVGLSPKDGKSGWIGSGDQIGWVDEEYVYLIPEAVRRAVARSLRDMGSHFPHSPRSLYPALLKRGALIPAPDEKSLTQVKIQGKNRKVLKLHRTALEPADDESSGDREG